MNNKIKGINHINGLFTDTFSTNRFIAVGKL